MQEYNRCYKCGLPINESQPTIITDGKMFHKSCTIMLQCYECRKVIGYQVRGDSSSDRIIYCVECAGHEKE
jgi:hypothetical protein